MRNFFKSFNLFGRRKSILLASYDISGHYSGLSEGFDFFGINHTLGAIPHNQRVNYQNKKIETILRIYILLTQNAHSSQRKNVLNKLISYFLQRTYSLIMPIWVVLNFKRVIFSQGRTYTDTIFELIIYKLFNTKVAVAFHGSDARPQYLSGHFYPPNSKINWQKMKVKTLATAKKIKTMEKYCYRIFVYPSVSHFFTKEFIYGPFGNPVIAPKGINNKKRINLNQEKIKIFHCPSDPIGKGSYEFRKIVNQLKKEGYKIELLEKTDVHTKEVHEGIIDSDIVFDSLWNDSLGGTFPAEGIYWGKPVIIGSYLAKAYPNLFDNNELAPPFIFVPPDKVKSVLIELCQNEDLRNLLKEKGLNYSKTHGSLKSISEKYIKSLLEKPNQNWIHNPNNYEYCYGYGADEIHIKYLIREYVKRFGASALCLDHKPIFKTKILEFANS